MRALLLLSLVLAIASPVLAAHGPIETLEPVCPTWAGTPDDLLAWATQGAWDTRSSLWEICIDPPKVDPTAPCSAPGVERHPLRAIP